MEWIWKTGWGTRILEYSQVECSHIGGICGGYQMLCKKITETSRSIDGLGLLEGETVINKEKTLISQVSAIWKPFGVTINGYEIHMGVTINSNNNRTILERVSLHTDESHPSDLGQQNDAGNIWGTYVHGIFDNFNFRTKVLSLLAVAVNDYSETILCSNNVNWKDKQFDLLSTHYEKHMDLEKLHFPKQSTL